MKLIKSNFLFHWKGNVSPFQRVRLFRESYKKYTVWEKCSYLCSKKWHSNHSDQSLKCNSLNTERDVAFIFHFAALISKGSWENKVFYSEGCRCRTLSWKRKQNLQCVVLQKCDGVGGTTAEHVYKIKRWSTFGNIALQASRKILQNLCPINQVERDWNLVRIWALSNVSNRRLEYSVSKFTVKHSKCKPVCLDWLALKLVEIRSFKTVVTIYLSTWRNIPQDLDLRHFHYEKFKSGSTSHSLCIQVQIDCTCSICNRHD